MSVYTLKKKFVEAEKYLQQSLELRKKLKDSFAIALGYSDLGYMYKEQGKFTKAAEQYGLSNALAIKMQYIELQKENYRALATIAENAGNFALSLNYYKKQNRLTDLRLRFPFSNNCIFQEAPNQKFHLKHIRNLMPI